MKIIIKEAIAYKDIKKYLPKRYSNLLSTSIGMKEEYVNLVIFPCDRKGVITNRGKSAYQRK